MLIICRIHRYLMLPLPISLRFLPIMITGLMIRDIIEYHNLEQIILLLATLDLQFLPVPMTVGMVNHICHQLLRQGLGLNMIEIIGQLTVEGSRWIYTTLQQFT